MSGIETSGVRASPEQIRALLQRRRDAGATALDAIVPRGPGANRLPLSFSQQRLWFLCQLSPSSTAYNNPVAARLRISAERSVDPALLESAINELITRHESLRTTFELDDGEPVQVVASRLRIPLIYVDLRQLPADIRERKAVTILAEDAQRTFDLSRGPLLRVTLLRLGDDDYMLLMNLHHLVSDAWSIGVFLKEMLTIALARKHGIEPCLPTLSIQYADFAMWQRQRMQGSIYERLASYWKQQLSPLPPMIVLPFARERTRDQHRGCSHIVAVSPELTTAVNEFARRVGTTPFVVLLTVFKLLLKRYTRFDDIAVGTPVANRTQRQVEGLIGCFINMLVLRTDLSGELSFIDAVARVAKTSTSALEHQEMPFELLVGEIQPERSLGANPLFQTMFSMQNAPVETNGIGAHVRLVELADIGTKFDLTLTAGEMNGALSLNWTFRAGLYDADKIERMAGHYLVLLEAALATPDAPVDMLSILTSAEQLELALLHGGTGAAHIEHTYAEWFDAAAREHTDAIAIRFGEQAFTYAELLGAANHIAQRLVASGVKHGDIVALLFERTPIQVASLLGVMKAGAAYLPLDPSWPARRLADILESAQCRLVVTTPQHAGMLPATAATLLLERADTLPEAAPAPHLGIRTTDLAYVIFTSGTTGRPKGIGVEHRHLVRYVENIAARMALPSGSSYAVVSTLSADLAHTMLFPCLVAGGTLLLTSEAQAQDPQALMQWFERYPADALKIVPSHLDALSDSANFELMLPRRLLVTGGEVLSAALVRKLSTTPSGFRWLNHYGPTETTVGVVVGDVARRDTSGSSPKLGRPLGDARIYICDSALGLLPLGVPGELCIGGGTVARGYLGLDELTAQRFHDDPYGAAPGARLYRSGDLARLHPDGEIEFLGRIDDQIKIRGFRIEIAEIEAALLTWPPARSAVVKAADTSSGIRLAAWIVADEGADRNELLAYLRQRVPAVMIPSILHFVASLPLTANGKIDRDALRVTDADTAACATEFIAPRTRMELAVAQLWSELLTRDRIGAHDDFFSLGGHSLLAVRLMAAVHKKFGIHLPLASLFEHATVERFARLLEGSGVPLSDGPVVSIQPRGSKVPLFLVHPAGGNVLCYYELTRALGMDQPVFGLQARSLSDGPEQSVESMAQRYVEAIRAAQPTGPYQLGGWSMGGIVAFEIARQLRATGAEVSLLAILDMPAPGSIARSDRERIDDATALAIYARKVELFSGQSLGMDRADVSTLDADALGDHLLGALRESRIVPEDVDATQLRRFMEVQRAHNLLTLNYSPSVYDGPLTVIRCASPPPIQQEVELLRLEALYADESLGWARFAARPPHVHVVPGNHVVMMAPPHVDAVAAALRDSLR